MRSTDEGAAAVGDGATEDAAGAAELASATGAGALAAADELLADDPPPHAARTRELAATAKTARAPGTCRACLERFVETFTTSPLYRSLAGARAGAARFGCIFLDLSNYRRIVILATSTDKTPLITFVFQYFDDQRTGTRMATTAAPTPLARAPIPLDEFFKVLSDPTRLAIVARMAAVEELACSSLEASLGVSKSTISHHIKSLYHAGLIEIRREGRFYHYRLKRDAVDAYVPGLSDRISHLDPT